jgi:hypothetical protein
MIKKILAGVALCGTIPAFAATNLVTDGSFENATLAAGDYALYSGSSLAGWTALPGSLIEVRDAIVGTAQDGNNFVELDSTHNSSMLTSFATTAGQSYTISFFYSGRPMSSAYNAAFPGGVVPASSNGLIVDFGTGPVTLTSPANTTPDNLWQQFTATFVALGTSTSLLFSAAGDNDSYGSSLDNISVTTAVPEPATLAMMAAGLLGLLGLGHRRGRNR